MAPQVFLDIQNGAHYSGGFRLLAMKFIEDSTEANSNTEEMIGFRTTNPNQA